MLLRTSIGCLYRSDSSDGGHTWSEAVATDIPNPNNKPKLIALPNGRIALIHTPNPGGRRFSRNPLSIWYSSDGLASFDIKHVITDFPGNFNYADGFCELGHINFSIEYNWHDILVIDHTVM